jgi:sugar lactone lactonase YvrE
MDIGAEVPEHPRMNRLLVAALSLVVLVAAAAAYLLLWPVPVEPVAWSAPPSPGYTGPHARNEKLARLEHLPLEGDVGPEHVVVREERGQVWVYMAVANASGQRGRIVRVKPDGTDREVIFDSGGRPLGFDFDAEGRLIVADPMWGDQGALLRVKGRGVGSQATPLVDNLAGDPIRYIDAVVVAPNGRIYFTDASRRFGAKAWGGTFEASIYDILEHQCTGRLIEHDPETRQSRLMMSGLCFPNGVALSEDGLHLFLAETGEYRIWKVSVEARGVDARQAAERPGDGARVLIANLPGYPDNIMRGQGGRLWTGLTKPRGAFIDDNAGRPWMRALAMRLPRSMWPVPPAYGHVFAFDESGKVLVDLQDPSGAYPETTAVTETADKLYIQSLHAKTLGVLDKRAAGL